jgi:hypothetical protein
MFCKGRVFVLGPLELLRQAFLCQVFAPASPSSPQIITIFLSCFLSWLVSLSLFFNLATRMICASPVLASSLLLQGQILYDPLLLAS